MGYSLLLDGEDDRKLTFKYVTSEESLDETKLTCAV